MADRPDDETRAFVRDSFLDDMARHQRDIKGELPTTRANEQLVAETLTRMENESAEAPPPAPLEDVSVEEPVADIERRAKEKGWKLIHGAPEGGVVLPTTSVERIAAERISARLQLLLTKEEPGVLGAPSWHDRVLAVIRTRMVDPMRARLELFELLEASSAVFGDWKADPGRPIFFT